MASSSLLNVLREHRGLDPPPGVHVPTAAELYAMCTAEHELGYAMGLAYPEQRPVFWIKYGYSVLWDEVPAQTMAYHELRKLNSSVRAPGIFYACKIGYKSYIVMEYIAGKPGGELLKSTEDGVLKQATFRQIAFAFERTAPHPRPSRFAPCRS